MCHGHEIGLYRGEDLRSRTAPHNPESRTDKSHSKQRGTWKMLRHGKLGTSSPEYRLSSEPGSIIRYWTQSATTPSWCKANRLNAILTEQEDRRAPQNTNCICWS